MNLKKNHIFLLVIVLFAIILRMVFFIGYANCQTQDDSLYIESIKNTYQNTSHYDSKLINESYINPSLIPTVRVMYLYPSAFFVWLFGLKELSFIIYPFVCSIGLIILLYFIGKNVFDEKVGLLSAFLLSFFPLDVIYSTRILPDVPLIFLIGLSIYFFLLTEKRKNRVYYFLSGLTLGLAYLTKEVAIIVIPFLFIYILYKKNIKKEYLFSVLGFVIIILAEMLFFYAKTGYALYRFHIISGAHLQKEMVELKDQIKTKNFDNIIQFSYPPGFEYFGHAKKFFMLYNKGPYVLEYFGFFYFFILFGVIYLISQKEKRSYFFLMWLIITYLYIEFGAFDIRLDLKNPPYIKYMIILKEADMSRLAMLLTIPSLILLASLLKNINLQISMAITLFLVFTSIYYINASRHLFIDGIKDTREAYEFIRNLPKKSVYGDYLAINQINFFSGFDPSISVKMLKNVTEVNDSYVVVDGSRGCEVLGSYIGNLTSELEPFPPENWEILKVIPGKKTYYREENITIFYAS